MNTEGDTAYDLAPTQEVRNLLGPVAPIAPIAPVPEPESLPIRTNECAICMENKNFNIDFDHPNRIKVLPCGHTFHQHCIALVNPNRCPTCRNPYVTPSNLMLGGYYNKFLKYQQKLGGTS